MRILLSVLLFLTLVSCKVTPSRRVQMPPPYESSGVRVQTTRMIRFIGNYVGVAGRLTNLGETRIQSCTVTYDALDLLSERVDVAEVTLRDIEPGDSVEFEAMLRKRKARELSRLEPGPLRISRE